MFGIHSLPKLLNHFKKSNSTLSVIHSHIVVVSPRRFSNISVISHVNHTANTASIFSRYLTHSAVAHCNVKPTNQTQNIGEYDTLTEYHAYDMIHKLSDNDRKSLSKALNKYESEKIKSKFQGNFWSVYFKKLCHSLNTVH